MGAYSITQPAVSKCVPSIFGKRCLFTGLDKNKDLEHIITVSSLKITSGPMIPPVRAICAESLGDGLLVYVSKITTGRP